MPALITAPLHNFTGTTTSRNQRLTRMVRRCEPMRDGALLCPKSIPRMNMTHRKRSGTIGLLVLVVGCLQIASAAPQDLFASMAGSWKGPGRIEFDGGASEALVCRAYYRTAQQANQLSIVLRCASQSNKIELRAKVATEGPGLTGTWEERTFNASGTATGQAMDGKIALSVDGGVSPPPCSWFKIAVSRASSSRRKESPSRRLPSFSTAMRATKRASAMRSMTEHRTRRSTPHAEYQKAAVLWARETSAVRVQQHNFTEGHPLAHRL